MFQLAQNRRPRMVPTPTLVRTREALARTLQSWRLAGQSHALVPTMGALHEGHLELVRLARSHASRVVVSIFVNPSQFAPSEDLTRYPRDEAGDLVKLASAGCDLVWAPDPREMYPAGFATEIIPKGAALGLEADFRPQFFAGVATVCTKLFAQVTPRVAIFGEKDFQQLCVVRQVVRDLDMPLTVIGAPTVREADGLAMSSRNRYLTAEQRPIAPRLHGELASLAKRIEHGDEIVAACRAASDTLNARGFRVEYVAARDSETLMPIKHLDTRPARVLAAAWLGATRLIDNLAVGPHSATRPPSARGNAAWPGPSSPMARRCSSHSF